ncbi:MAG TPA: FAD-dependent oxidoreductase [Streptosporangiaceae bacterium]|nr:FAD-dependent oxidoreductase [Streptosporangiaceae bacterium]
MRAIVVGGGLAGITAAIALAEQGASVTLLEAKPRLGGATCSFSRGGLTVDTGQHVFLRCCTAYRGLLDTLGVTAHAPLQHRFDISVLAPDGAARLRRSWLPAPLHLLTSLPRYRFLSFAERSAVSRAALAMRRVDPADPVTDTVRFGDWLAQHGQTEHARRVLWDLFSVSALNVAGDDASLSLAATVVKTGLLGRNDAADIGVPARPLGELHGDAAARRLARLGAEIRLNAKVTAIAPAPPEEAAGSTYPPGPRTPEGAAGSTYPHLGGFVVHVREGSDDAGALAADAVVLAVPAEQAARLIPADALPSAEVAGWTRLGASPIVNVHVIYDRKVLDLPFAAAVNSPVQWIFDRTQISGLGGRDGAQYLALSQSAADDYVDTPVAELREMFLPALAELMPKARDARVVEFFVTRERHATFRQVPGSGELRPGAGTKLPGLVLAGSWTSTGWPDTMEGAVRSGLTAAIELRRTLKTDSLGAGSLGGCP